MNDAEKFRHFSVINDFLRQHEDYTPDNREEYERFKKQLLDLNKPLKNMNTRDLLVRKKNTELKNMFIETRERFHAVERKERSKGLVDITSPKVEAYLDQFNLVKTAANTPLPQQTSHMEIEEEEEEGKPVAVSCKSCFGRRKTKKKGKKSYDKFEVYGGKRRRRKKKTRKKRGGNGKKKKGLVKKGIAETDGKGLPEYPYIQIDNPPEKWKMEGGRHKKKTRKNRRRRKKKTRKKRGGEKSKKIKKLTKIFQQYPKIFPSGYFRFLAARLENHINKNTLWYRNGVVLTWIKYQKTVKKTPKCIIKPGDIKLDQIVNKNQGNGAAKKVVLQFLKKFEKNRIWLEVRANNKRAIKFYKKNGFKNICKIKFGDIPGIMMVKK